MSKESGLSLGSAPRCGPPVPCHPRYPVASSSALMMGDGPRNQNDGPGDLCFLLFQLVKKLSDLTGCTQVVDVGSGQVSQTPVFWVF